MNTQDTKKCANSKSTQFMVSFQNTRHGVSTASQALTHYAQELWGIDCCYLYYSLLQIRKPKYEGVKSFAKGHIINNS